MAKMVTRTVITSKVNALCVDVAKAVTFNKEFLIGAVKDKKEALKTLKKANTDENVEIVSIISIENEEQLYGMTEETFLAYAEKLPPRGTKTEDIVEAND